MILNDYGNYRNMRFSDIFQDVETFQVEYQASPFYDPSLTKVSTIFYLLYANHGNDPIANADINLFKFRLWATIFMYAPTWEKRLEVQAKIRGLSDDDIFKGGQAIYNHAYNDGGAPSTDTLEPLKYLNEQNTTNHKKSKLEGYALLTELLETDVTKEFITKFKSLFLKVIQPELPWYENNTIEYYGGID